MPKTDYDGLDGFREDLENIKNELRTDTSIVVTFRFEGFHRWSKAPDSDSFLRGIHRHEFHVRASRRVSRDDREIEFISFKKRIKDHVESKKKQNLTLDWSCERWAQYILDAFELESVEVMEDGENGALVVRRING